MGAKLRKVAEMPKKIQEKCAWGEAADYFSHYRFAISENPCTFATVIKIRMMVF
jgi:hypothetical protein